MMKKITLFILSICITLIAYPNETSVDTKSSINSRIYNEKSTNPIKDASKKTAILKYLQEDPKLNNCTVRLFDTDGFDYTDDWVDIGEGEYADLDDISGKNWTDEADSFIVGEGTEVTMYPEADFKGEAKTYGPGKYDNDISEPSSMKVVCKSLGTKKQVFEHFKFFPNPLQDQLSLSSSKPIERINVYDTLGKQILSAKPQALATNISTENLQTGVYLMQVQIEARQKTFKVLKD